MFKTIVVPIDGSSLAAHALPFATAIARAANGKVLLVRAVKDLSLAPANPMDSTILTDIVPFESNALAEAKTNVSAMVRQLEVQGLQVEGIVYEESPAVAIVAAAHRVDADLIVMSTHGRTGLGRFFLGSVTEAVLGETDLPILVIPATSATDWSHPTTGSGRRIIVPLDGSDYAEEALDPALELAELLGDDLTLLSVVETAAGGTMDGFMYDSNDLPELRASAHEYLARVINPSHLGASKVPVHPSVEEGHAMTVIAHAATSPNVDAVVAATHGLSGLRQVVMGSVAQALLHSSRVPVLLLRPTEVREHHARLHAAPEATV